MSDHAKVVDRARPSALALTMTWWLVESHVDAPGAYFMHVFSDEGEARTWAKQIARRYLHGTVDVMPVRLALATSEDSHKALLDAAKASVAAAQRLRALADEIEGVTR